ncbi:MAG: cobalamin biosynthesis protein [Candidatus Hodgkinia cicadicola]
MLLAYKNMLWHANEVLNRLYSTHIRLCKYRLSSIVGKSIEDLNEHNICNSILLSLTENFNDATVLPLFYYLIAGLPGLMMYKTHDLADSMLANFKSINRNLASGVCKIDSVLAAYPCFGLLVAMFSMAKAASWLKSMANTGREGLLNPQCRGLCRLMWIGSQWLDIKIGTGGRYGHTVVIGKHVNDVGRGPNSIDIAHIMLAMCALSIALTGTIIIIRHHWIAH